MLQENLPPSVLRVLDAGGVNHGPVLPVTTSDLTLSGDVQRHWIVVTKEHVSIVAEGTAPHLERTVRLDEVEQFRAMPVVGSGLLQAWLDGTWIDLARYTNQQSDRFHRIARKLEQLRTQGGQEGVRWLRDCTRYR